MSDRQYRNAAQERILRILNLLPGNEFQGLTPSEIARSLDISPSNVTRDLRVLQSQGYAEQIPDIGRWRCGPKHVQHCNAFQLHLAEVHRRYEEIKQRYTRLP